MPTELINADFPPFVVLDDVSIQRNVVALVAVQREDGKYIRIVNF